MGLDQYLYASKYVGDSKWNKEDERNLFASIVKNLDAKKFMTGDLPGIEVKIQVAYWRKADEIHEWFVENVQGGVDDCRTAYVTRENLHELLSVCKTAVEHKDQETGLRPEWYWDDLDKTILNLTQVLENTPDNFDFYYHASW